MLNNTFNTISATITSGYGYITDKIILLLQNMPSNAPNSVSYQIKQLICEQLNYYSFFFGSESLKAICQLPKNSTHNTWTIWPL
eukprot:UN05487